MYLPSRSDNKSGYFLVGFRMFQTLFMVLEIAFDSIQKSNRHDSVFALRFPTIKNIREDKHHIMGKATRDDNTRAW